MWSGTVCAVILALLPFVAGCDDDPVEVDLTPPFPPDGVFSITGDRWVEILWNENWEDDLAAYGIYKSTAELGPYDHITDVPASQLSYVVTNINNGETWYYAVAAFDRAGNESEWSFDEVFDTPRPAGTGLILYDYMGQKSDSSGYDFSSVSGAAQGFASQSTDIYFGQSNGVNYIVAQNSDHEVDIQDFGVTDSLDEIDWAPLDGWAPSLRAEAIPLHSYIVRIRTGVNFNYAKFRVTSLTGIDVDTRRVVLEWAYQPSLSELGNQELSPGRKGGAGK